jgi:hypothetical protein
MNEEEAKKLIAAEVRKVFWQRLLPLATAFGVASA